MSFDSNSWFHGVSSLRRAIRLALALFMGSQFALSSLSMGMESVNTRKKIIVFGDSLTAGYQLPTEASFPVALETFLKAKGRAVEVVNASVSGDTSTAGLERLEWSLGDGADLVILELGANDMLRGIDARVTYRALDLILASLQEKKITVLLAGMKASRGLGTVYRDEFESIYPQLSTKYGVTLYPFFLEGIAERPEFNLPDGIHPNREGILQIVDRIGPVILGMLQLLESQAPPK